MTNKLIYRYASIIVFFALCSIPIIAQNKLEKDVIIGLNQTHFLKKENSSFSSNTHSVSNHLGISSGIFLKQTLRGFLGTYLSSEVLLEKYKLSSESSSIAMSYVLNQSEEVFDNQLLLINLNLGLTISLPEKLKSDFLLGIYFDLGAVQFGSNYKRITEYGYWENTSSSLVFVNYDPPLIEVVENENTITGSIGTSFAWKFRISNKLGLQLGYNYAFGNSEFPIRNNRFVMKLHWRLGE